MRHSLYSQDQEIHIQWFDKFDKEEIKKHIISHLKQFPKDVLEHTKEFSKSDIRRVYGSEIVNFYAVNPKTKEISLIVTRGNKEYFKSIE